MFAFDRRSPRQRQARETLLPALGLAAVAYLALDPLLSRLLGGFWGVQATLIVVGLPLGALWWVGETGDRPRQAWRAGAVLAVAVGAIYAWVFAGFWR
jgi:hypothetical protein